MLECVYIDMCMCISIRVCIYVHTYAVCVRFHMLICICIQQIYMHVFLGLHSSIAEVKRECTYVCVRQYTYESVEI